MTTPTSGMVCHR